MSRTFSSPPSGRSAVLRALLVAAGGAGGHAAGSPTDGACAAPADYGLGSSDGLRCPAFSGAARSSRSRSPPLGMPCGLVLGLGLALMRLSRLAPVRVRRWCLHLVIRGTPLMLQLVFLYDALPASASGSTVSPPPCSASR